MTSQISASPQELVSRFLDVIEKDIAPKTREAVKDGNKVFGGAVLKKSDLSLVIADTNNAARNPLFHGEVHTITKLYERDHSTLPDPRDCIFLATHEPCSLCLSAITWTGYDNFYYLFSYEDTRDSFAIPYDIEILQEVFAVPPLTEAEKNSSSVERPLYNRTNKFWASHHITKMMETLEPSARAAAEARVAELGKMYASFSDVYQDSKGGKEVAFG